MALVHKPYTDGPGHVVMGRDAHRFLPDIEAYLAGQELSTELAPTVAGIMTAFGCTVERAVDVLRPVLLLDPRTP